MTFVVVSVNMCSTVVVFDIDMVLVHVSYLILIHLVGQGELHHFTLFTCVCIFVLCSLVYAIQVPFLFIVFVCCCISVYLHTHCM